MLSEGYLASAGLCVPTRALASEAGEKNYRGAVPHAPAENAGTSSSPEEPSHNYLM